MVELLEKERKEWQLERLKLIHCIHLQQIELSQRSAAAYDRATDIAKVTQSLFSLSDALSLPDLILNKVYPARLNLIPLYSFFIFSLVSKGIRQGNRGI